MKALRFAYVLMGIFLWNHSSSFAENPSWCSRKSFNSFADDGAKESYLYTIKFILPHGVKLTEELCGFYKGKPIEFDKRWALLPTDDESFAFSILITPQVHFTFDGNNVSSIRRVTSVPFKWFDLTLQASKRTGTYHWNITELKKDEAPNQIPDHAIIVLLDPKFIEKLTSPVNPCPDQPSGKIIALPSIAIDEYADEDELNEACELAQLASIDLRTIHQKPELLVKQEPLSILTLHKN